MFNPPTLFSSQSNWTTKDSYSGGRNLHQNWWVQNCW